MEQVPRGIEMKPRLLRPAGLPTGKVRHGHESLTPRLENPVDFRHQPPRVGNVFQNMPDDHLIEKPVRIADRFETRSRADEDARIISLGGLRTDLEAMRLDSPIRQMRKNRAAATADIEHPSPATHMTRQQRHPPPADEPHDDF